MINIRGLSFLFFVSIVTAHDIELRIPELSDQHLQYLKELGQQYPGKTMKIEVLPETTFFEKIKNSLAGNGNSESKGQGDGFSTKSAVFYFIKSCFGASAVSYFSIAYIIYRAYKIAKKISLWFKEDDKEESDTMSDIERMLSRNRTFKLSKSDKKWIKLYMKIDSFLREKKLRSFFFFKKESDFLIKSYYKTLSRPSNPNRFPGFVPK